MPPRIAAIVLAAGSSSRLGRSKQLLEFDGTPLLRRTVQTVLASSVDEVIVTLPQDNKQLASALDGLTWTRADVTHPERGQSESVRTGLQTVEKRGNFQAVLITPCDLPLLSVSHLNALIETYSQGQSQIVASRYAETLGAPVVFGSELWPELHALGGDTGARKIIARHPETTSAVDWENGHFDLDTPEDVDAFTKRNTTSL